jgi:hypothetical protein
VTTQFSVCLQSSITGSDTGSGEVSSHLFAASEVHLVRCLASAAVREDLQHIRVRSCAPPNIIELFGSQLTTAGDAAVMTMRAISWLSG